MALAAHWPVPIATAGPATGGVALFRHAGQLHVTCVVKATFALVPDAPMTSVPPEELFRAEAHHRDNPARSIRATSDLVPYLPRVDIVLTGHACAPAGQSVTRQAVRLAVFRDQALLDKTLHVYGDRAGAELKPFERMPLVYERALGGIGFRQNPHGTGKAPGSASPNIVYPSDGSLVAGYGPVSRALVQRKSLLGSLPMTVFEQAAPELPADFDWAYFQAAPPDQQIPSLVGNEWIVLEGMHPEHRRLASRLPTVRGLATLFGLDPGRPDAAHGIALRPDILRIDADSLRCSLVCRAVVGLPDEGALRTLRIAAGIETETLALVLPSPPSLVPDDPRHTVAAVVDDDDLAETLLRGEQASSATLAIDDTPQPLGILPFTSPTRAAQPATRQAVFESTLAHEAQHGPVLPFAERQGAVPAAPEAPIPGAPWSHVAVESAPKPVKGELTVSLSNSALVAELLPPSPTFPPPTAPPSSDGPGPTRSVRLAEAAVPPAMTRVSAETPPEPASAPPKPPPPRIPAKPPVNKSLYGGFVQPRKKS